MLLHPFRQKGVGLSSFSTPTGRWKREAYPTIKGPKMNKQLLTNPKSTNPTLNHVFWCFVGWWLRGKAWESGYSTVSIMLWIFCLSCWLVTMQQVLEAKRRPFLGRSASVLRMLMCYKSHDFSPHLNCRFGRLSVPDVPVSSLLVQGEKWNNASQWFMVVHGLIPLPEKKSCFSCLEANIPCAVDLQPRFTEKYVVWPSPKGRPYKTGRTNIYREGWSSWLNTSNIGKQTLGIWYVYIFIIK
jgi:hypothetical protein